MTIADRAKAAQVNVKGGQCTTGLMLDSMLPDVRVEVEDALADMTIYASTIATILADDGYDIAAEALNRHRRGRCKCQR